MRLYGYPNDVLLLLLLVSENGDLLYFSQECRRRCVRINDLQNDLHSFIPRLKPSFSANPSHRILPFLLQDSLHGFPGLFTDTSEHIRFFLLFSFSVFHFLVVGSVR